MADYKWQMADWGGVKFDSCKSADLHRRIALRYVSLIKVSYSLGFFYATLAIYNLTSLSSKVVSK